MKCVENLTSGKHDSERLMATPDTGVFSTVVLLHIYELSVSEIVCFFVPFADYEQTRPCSAYKYSPKHGSGVSDLFHVAG